MSRDKVFICNRIHDCDIVIRLGKFELVLAILRFGVNVREMDHFIRIFHVFMHCNAVWFIFQLRVCHDSPSGKISAVKRKCYIRSPFFSRWCYGRGWIRNPVTCFRINQCPLYVICETGFHHCIWNLVRRHRPAFRKCHLCTAVFVHDVCIKRREPYCLPVIVLIGVWRYYISVFNDFLAYDYFFARHFRSIKRESHVECPVSHRGLERLFAFNPSAGRIRHYGTRLWIYQVALDCIRYSGGKVAVRHRVNYRDLFCRGGNLFIRLLYDNPRRKGREMYLLLFIIWIAVVEEDISMFIVQCFIYDDRSSLVSLRIYRNFHLYVSVRAVRCEELRDHGYVAGCIPQELSRLGIGHHRLQRILLVLDDPLVMYRVHNHHRAVRPAELRVACPHCRFGGHLWRERLLPVVDCPEVDVPRRHRTKLPP